MYSWEKTGDRVALVQMNAELRHAQLELLSAQCATDRLRLRFSAEDIAQYAQRDVLRKACRSAAALHDFYTYVASRVEDPGSLTAVSAANLNDERIVHDIRRVEQYFREQRDLYIRDGKPLSSAHREPIEPFFSSQLLDKIRITVLDGQRVAPPAFFAEIQALGFSNLPDLSHMSSLTFGDVVVFQVPIEPRRLFHALVHAAQFEILGVPRYADLFVRGFARTRSYITVPLETHTLLLETKFAAEPAHPFSVEEKIRLWVDERRYEKS